MPEEASLTFLGTEAHFVQIVAKWPLINSLATFLKQILLRTRYFGKKKKKIVIESKRDKALLKIRPGCASGSIKLIT